MTNDKAISLLRAMQEPGPWDPQITEPAFEALEMAIEALEHTGDCILEQFGECSYIETGCGDCKVKRRISEALELKSRKGRWIPVTRIYKVTEGHFPKMHIKWVDAIEPDDIDGVRCSECGTVYDFAEARNWCSECGADMRNVTDE